MAISICSRSVVNVGLLIFRKHSYMSAPVKLKGFLSIWVVAYTRNLKMISVNFSVIFKAKIPFETKKCPK